MGAWGTGPFDNDEAADWAYRFDDVDYGGGLALVADALRAAVETPGDEYLDSEVGVAAIAAAELVAARKGHAAPATVYGESALKWAAADGPRPDADLIALAVASVGRVIADNSELAELWAEAGDEWSESVDDLRRRLIT